MTTIGFSREREIGYCKEKTEDWCFYIEDGDVKKVYYSAYISTPMSSQDLGSFYYNKGEAGFERELGRGLRLLKIFEREQFNKLISIVDKEVLEQYI